MTTKANSQLGCEVLPCFFVQFSEQLELVSEGFAPFYLTEQNKDVCEQSLKSRTKMSANIFVQFSANSWSLFLKDFAPFYLTEQNKDVCEQKLEEQNKDVC